MINVATNTAIWHPCQQQGGRPHSLCENDAYDSEENFARVTRFRATGSITLEAFAYLWKRAKTLQEMRISGIDSTLKRPTG